MASEGRKDDDGKVGLDLWSPDALIATAEVLDFGAAKYDAYNWAQGISYRRVFSALLRHLWAFWRGENNDKETGLPHLAHAMCCLMFLLHYTLNNYEEYDDRPNYRGSQSTRNSKEELSGPRGQRGEDCGTVGTTEPAYGHISGPGLDLGPSAFGT